jgi:hypothetical protein
MFHFFPNQPKLEYFFLTAPELVGTNRCRSAPSADLPLPHYPLAAPCIHPITQAAQRVDKISARL